MNHEPAAPKKRNNRRRLTALVLLSLFVCVLGMAQFESLHRAIHCDAAQPEHQCAVTLIQTGQMDSPATAIVPAQSTDKVSSQSVVDAVFIAQPAFVLLPSRGPPALS